MKFESVVTMGEGFKINMFEEVTHLSPVPPQPPATISPPNRPAVSLSHKNSSQTWDDYIVRCNHYDYDYFHFHDYNYDYLVRKQITIMITITHMQL